jgi:hypothetical protein
MILDEKYIQEYSDSLEQKVLENLVDDKVNQKGKWNLKKAHDYLQRTVETLFGTDAHTGIVQYLLENQNHLGLSLDEAVSKGEKLLSDGWSIKQRGPRYFLQDSNFATVQDVTGSADIVEAETTLEEFGQENTYLFLTEPDARNLAQLATKHKVDLTELKSASFTYEMVKKYQGTNGPLFPVAQNYKGLSEVLRKTYFFNNTFGLPMVSLLDMYDEGYRISPRVNPTEFTKVYLKGIKDYAVIPVSGEKTQFGDSSDVVSIQVQQFVRDQFSDVEVEDPQMIAEMGQVYALLFEQKPEVIGNQDLGEVLRLLASMRTQNKQGNYPLYNKMMTSVVELYIFYVLGLGATTFNLSLLGIDHIKPRVYLKYSTITTFCDSKELDKFFLNTEGRRPSAPDAMEVILKGSGLSEYLRDNISLLLPFLGDDFGSRITKFKGNSEIEQRLSKLSNFLGGAK